MISVIVPIYNTEQYLPKCIDSILSQTYRDLDMILIDDGSLDGCGHICDLYAEKDRRIRVFHTSKQGLSGARNLGIEKALDKKSKYIAFADSDDRLEPTMYETLVNTAEKSGCDVVVCGFFCEKNDVYKIWTKPEKRMDHTEAIRELFKGGLTNAVWNKLWRAECFSFIRFPEGWVYEDIATTYRVFDQIQELIRIPDPLYHYFTAREGSIVNTHDIKNTIGKWISHKQRYDDLSSDVRFVSDKAIRDKMDESLASVIVSIWKQKDCKINYTQGRLYAAEFRAMNMFAKKHYASLRHRKRSFGWNLIFFLSRFHYIISLKIARFCVFFQPFYHYIQTKIRSGRK